jgi:putative redox protein
MDAKVVWRQRMTFDASADSGFTVTMGADPSVGGDDDGPRPMEFLLMGLAGCTAMDVLSILNKKRQKVTGFEVRAHADRAPGHPKIFTAITLHYIVRGQGIDPAAVQRAMELSEKTYCPAQAMFSQVAPITLSYEIIEETPPA